MNFLQKLVVHYILHYFGILFIVDILCAYRIILWDQRLLKGFVLRENLRDQGTYK